MSSRLRIPPILCAACAVLALSCAERAGDDGVRGDFDRIASGTLDLYRELHPLRWSRLGLEGADSLLFTFTEGEVTRAIAGLDSLIDALSSLPAAGLDRGRLDDSFLLLDWMKGERFALGKGGAFRNNPLLYCWMIEEALFGIPSRPAPPHPGEDVEYARRLRALPALAESAGRLLERPGTPLLEEAVRRLDRIVATIPALAAEAGRRYGRPIPECSAAAGPVARLRGTISGMLESRPRGRLIMGLEDLSTVLKFAEHLDADPASLTAEAENTLGRLGRSPRAARGPSIPRERANADPDSVLLEIETAAASRRISGRAQSPAPVVVAEPLYTPLRLPVDPYLTVPVIPCRDAHAAAGGKAGGGCEPVIAVRPGLTGDPDRLFYDLLLASSPMTAPVREACRAQMPLRAVFSSETFRRGWESILLQELAPLFPGHREAISRIEGEERMLALARMVVVFRLHAGVYTTEAAAAFLAETTGLSERRIADEVAAAAASPAAAFDGIAAILIDRMRKTVAAGQSESNRRLKDLLLENGMLPLALVEKKMPR